MYDTVLYPTDGSEGSDAAAEHARALASSFDATVHVLSVVDTQDAEFGLSGAFFESEPGMSGDAEGGESGMVGGREDPDDSRSKRVEHRETLVDNVADHLDDVATVTAVEAGTPHEAILAYVDDNDIDLVVMGTHGRTGVERYLLGSVTEKVVRLSDVPVVTIRSDSDAAPG